MIDDQLDELISTMTAAEAGAVLDVVELEIEKKRMQSSLPEFIRGAWHILEPGRDLVWNWHLDILCAYLLAVHDGRIRRLIVNIPPGTMKSMIVSVFYPAWKWLQDPSHRFLCGSNDDGLAIRDAVKMRSLIESEWFRTRWGKVVSVSSDHRAKDLFSNTSKGHRESQSFNAKVTGKRGDTLIVDDPHDTKKIESDVQRKEVLESWDTAWTSRMNDPDLSSVIVVMQRIHAKDLTGHLMSKRQKWVRLAIPMRYEGQTQYSFSSEKDIGVRGFNDPRTTLGELMFPARVSESAVRDLEEDLGPYGTAGQLQQRPNPKTGGEMQRSWIMRYKSKPRNTNNFILVDPAGERKQGVKGKRDNSAMGVFGVGEDNNIYVLDGYRDRLNVSERAEILFRWHRLYNPYFVGYESYGMQTDVTHIESLMEAESYRFKITELGGSLTKEDRIRKLIPKLSAHRIWFPESLYRTLTDGRTIDIIDQFIEKEYLPFPVGEFDDFFDMMARIEDVELKKPQLGRRRRNVRHHR